MAEILDHLTVAVDEGYFTEQESTGIEEQSEKVFKLINGYIAYLDREIKGK